MHLPAHRGRRYGVYLLAALAVLVLLVVLLPWNALRGPLAKYASARFERPVTIGHLDVDLGRKVVATLDGVTIGNVKWSSDNPMVDAKRVVLRFTWGSLLRLTPVKVTLADTRVLLQRNAEGEDNWHFGSGGSTAVPAIGNIAVERGVIDYRDAKVDARIDLAVDTKTAPGGDVLVFAGKGTLHGEPLAVEGTSAGLAELQDPHDPYRVAIDVRAARSVLRFEGTVLPADTENIRGQLALSGPDMSKLYPLVPAPIPWTPPYRLTGELAHQGHVWTFRGFKGVVGDSDLAGDARLEGGGPRTRLVADLTSKRFDYKDLGGFVGLPPGQPAVRAKSADQKREETRRRLTYRVLPDKPLELTKLRNHDAEVKFRGTSVKWGDIPMDNLVANLTLANGVLRFHPLDFGLANGHVVTNLTVDVTGDVARAEGDVVARNLELKRIFPQLASPKGTAGRFGGQARFKTQGNTVADMLGSANGQAAVIMRGGEASTLTLVLTNLDLHRAAELLLRGDQTAEIRCAVASLTARDGVMTPDLFVVDTSAVLITGEGNVDFRQEEYELGLRAKSKQMSLLALRGPIVIDGTFKDPVVRPAIGPIAARVGAAIGLGALAPPLALLPLIDFGGAPDQDCRGLMQAAHVDAAATVPAPARTRAKAARPTPTRQAQR